jgi:hypothetical protein
MPLHKDSKPARALLKPEQSFRILEHRAFGNPVAHSRLWINLSARALEVFHSRSTVPGLNLRVGLTVSPPWVLKQVKIPSMFAVHNLARKHRVTGLWH